MWQCVFLASSPAYIYHVLSDLLSLVVWLEEDHYIAWTEAPKNMHWAALSLYFTSLCTQSTLMYAAAVQ